MEGTLSAPVATVFGLLTVPKWLEARCLAVGELSASCKARKSAGGVTVTMRRRVLRDLTAEFALTPQGKGCVYRIQHSAKVRVPLLGGVVEKFVVGQSEQACADELDYLVERLKSRK